MTYGDTAGSAPAPTFDRYGDPDKMLMAWGGGGGLGGPEPNLQINVMPVWAQVGSENESDAAGVVFDQWTFERPALDTKVGFLYRHGRETICSSV